MQVDSQLSDIPTNVNDLGASSTGIGAVISLSGMQNVQGRVTALSGAISDSFRAAAASEGVSLVLNSSAIAASLSSVSTAWTATSGNNGTVGVQAVSRKEGLLNSRGWSNTLTKSLLVNQLL